MVHQFALHFITTMIRVIIAVLLLLIIIILLLIIIMNIEWMINDALVPTDHT